MFYPAAYLSRVWMGSNLSSKLLRSTARPLSSHIKLTENCQARCISCDYWKSRWQDHIDTGHAVDLVNQIGAIGIRTLRLTGGESLLRKDVFEILRKADTSNFKRIIVQTNGLLLKKLHKEVNASPITNVCVSVDGLAQTKDQIRGIRGYFDLAVEGIKLLRNKRVALSITLNRMSARELKSLSELARSLGADVEFNILSRSLYFLQNADFSSLWPEKSDVAEIVMLLRETAKRPDYEVKYIRQYYSNGDVAEPPCILGFLQDPGIATVRSSM
jgi:MoaA/NifB/PqqE/SkfB family radical SAM enzyme